MTRQKQLHRRPVTKQLKNNSLSSSSVASNCWLCFAAVILEMADSTVSSRISSNIFFLAASLWGLINSSISRICKSGKQQVKTWATCSSLSLYNSFVNKFKYKKPSLFLKVQVLWRSILALIMQLIITAIFLFVNKLCYIYKWLIQLINILQVQKINCDMHITIL